MKVIHIIAVLISVVASDRQGLLVDLRDCLDQGNGMVVCRGNVRNDHVDICKFETGWTEAKCFTEVNTELNRAFQKLGFGRRKRAANPAAQGSGGGLKICRIGLYINTCVTLGRCVCTYDWNPVCGYDGRTYSNACKAGCNRMGIAYYGEC